MAYVSNFNTGNGVFETLTQSVLRGIDAVAQAMTIARSMDQRMRELDRLNSKSDAELAALNLTRADIPRTVFHDIL